MKKKLKFYILLKKYFDIIGVAYNVRTLKNYRLFDDSTSLYNMLQNKFEEYFEKYDRHCSFDDLRELIDKEDRGCLTKSDMIACNKFYKVLKNI